jgi:hypothetical protein
MSPAFHADVSQRSLHHDAKRRSLTAALQSDRQEAASQTTSPTPAAVPRFDGAPDAEVVQPPEQPVRALPLPIVKPVPSPVAQPLPPPVAAAAPRLPPQPAAKKYVSVAVGSSQVVPLEAVSPQLKRRRSDEAAPAAPAQRLEKRPRHTIADARPAPQAGKPLVPRHSSARYHDFSRDDEEGEPAAEAAATTARVTHKPAREAQQASEAGPSRHAEAERRKMRDVKQWRDRSSAELGVVDNAPASPRRRAAPAAAPPQQAAPALAPPQARERERSNASTTAHTSTHEERLARAKAKFTRDVCAFRDEYGFSIVAQALPYLRSGDVARGRERIEADIAHWGSKYGLSRGDVISSIREAQGDVTEAKRLMQL